MSVTSPVVVLGECVADAFAAPREAGAAGLDLRVLPGGGPANTAVALARLGTPTRFLGRLSSDPFGQLFRDHLTASGVDLSGCPAAAEPSTLAIAALDAEGRAEYTFHAEGTADWQWTDAELRAGLPPRPAALHTGSLALVRDPGADRIEQLLTRVRPHTTVSIDPNVRPQLVDPRTYGERLPRWCAVADILRLSDDDVAHLHPGVPLEQVCDRWHAAGVRCVVVTLGAKGVFASLDGERTQLPAPHTRVVDSVGAGDSFMAGLLHRLHGQNSLGGRLDGLTPDQLADALTFGMRVAAATCAVPGADPPWANQLAPEDDR